MWVIRTRAGGVGVHPRRCLRATPGARHLPLEISGLTNCALNSTPGPTSSHYRRAHVITAVKGAEADHVPIKTALLSVSDKAGLVDLGKALGARGVKVCVASFASQVYGYSQQNNA